MNKIFTTLLVFSLALASVSAQINYTANQQVTPYVGPYRAGINMGYYPGWTNQSLADIAAGNPTLGIPGIGAKTSRVGLPEIVLDYFGYGLLEGDFQHYKSVGMDEFTAFTNGPTWPHQEKTQYCPGQWSPLFANMYTPIWDGGANGTPYNDTNYYAVYLYKVVSQYKDDVRFWEVWNEPGFDFANLGWRGPDYPGNWWLEGPKPCDYILRAPIYSYIRALHIAWEVIKTVDPDAYVCISGVGYLSFLNAVLRNTDNPNNGDVSPEYPLLGGAYFDGVAIHSYPHFDGSTTNYGANFFQRHSDQAADGVAKVVNDYQGILDQYGYDGVTYPKKEWICTEINSPRKAFTGEFFAGHDAQINHMMKAQMVAKINGIHQLNAFQLIDQQTEEDASYEFHQMGMYQKIDGVPAYQQEVNDLGIALKTMTDLVFATQYDPVRSAAMNLPDGARGYAWKRPDGTYVYSVWARTTQDLSEVAAAAYSFPAAFSALNWKRYDWDYGYTGTSTLVSGQNIALDARPVFFTAENVVAVCRLQASIKEVKCSNNGTTNPGDDTYEATLTVNGTNTSGEWTATVGGQTVNGTVGTSVVLGPLPITAGDLTFVVRDAANAQCTTSVTITPPAPCSTPNPGIPCPSRSDFPWHDWIAQVQVGDINNSSGKTTYTDFSNLFTDLQRTTPTSIALTTGFSWTTFEEHWKVWIDYNHNHIFEEPAEIAFEGVLPKPANGTPTAALNGTITVPTSALFGATRMRISMTHSGVPTPCGTLASGEVEDYTVHILPGAFSRIPSPENLSASPSREQQSLFLYPNPASDYVMIDLRAYQHQEGRLRVYNAQGQLVTEMPLALDQPGLLPLSLLGYANGSYVVQLQAGAKTAVGRMEVAH
ncbi:MAG: GEVED domain-containing protein [Saprospiraceae bacterium]|nr:GEVED domain-containing protein [Saprospiraceae bacterium]